MARPPEKLNAEIIEAGLAIEAETGQQRVRPTTIRDRIGGGNISRIRQVWDDYCEDRVRAAAAENDPDLILPPALLDLLESDQAAQLARSKERFMAIYRAVKKEATAAFAVERAAFIQNAAAIRGALRDADDQNDKLAADIMVIRRQADEAQAMLANERRRSDRLEGQLVAAERATSSAQEAATLARSDRAECRSELASMTERALKAELAIEQGRGPVSKTKATASRESSRTRESARADATVPRRRSRSV